MKYRVEVAWITKEVSYATIEVEAEDEREAEKLALDVAPTVDFKHGDIIDADYVIESVECDEEEDDA
jgi:hypothetical protein